MSHLVSNNIHAISAESRNTGVVIGSIKLVRMNIDSHSGRIVHASSCVGAGSIWNDIGLMHTDWFSICCSVISCGNPFHSTIFSPLLGNSEGHSISIEILNFNWFLSVHGRPFSAGLNSSHHTDLCWSLARIGGRYLTGHTTWRCTWSSTWRGTWHGTGTSGGTTCWCSSGSTSR